MPELLDLGMLDKSHQYLLRAMGEALLHYEKVLVVLPAS
jgi:hypothetical protein